MARNSARRLRRSTGPKSSRYSTYDSATRSTNQSATYLRIRSASDSPTEPTTESPTDSQIQCASRSWPESATHSVIPSPIQCPSHSMNDTLIHSRCRLAIHLTNHSTNQWGNRSPNGSLSHALRDILYDSASFLTIILRSILLRSNLLCDSVGCRWRGRPNLWRLVPSPEAMKWLASRASSAARPDATK